MSTVIIILINFLKFEVKKKNNNEGHEWLKKKTMKVMKDLLK